MNNLSKEILRKLKRYNGLSNKISHVKSSDLALKNKLEVFGKFEPVQFDKEIDWNYKHSHSVATFQIYLHCLHFIRTLTNSYLTTKETKYLEKAKDLILQWIESPQTKNYESPNSAWRDHSTASRMKNLLHYQMNVPSKYKINQEVFQNTLIKHSKFLSLKEYYSENNHGMMSDEGLLFLSNFILDEEKAKFYQEISVLRMERIIYKLFSSQSYNLENSPEYHRLTQNLSSRFIRLADMMEIEFDERCRNIIKKSFLNNKKVIKPDLSYPLIGDTGYSKSKLDKSFENFIDYQAGFVVLNSKNNEDKEASSWFSFKSGYLSRSHKHRDDLSINYVHKGEDVLIDTGKYTYDRRKPFKSYVMSPVAHSTIHNINSDYSLVNIVDDVDLLKTTFVYENDAYTHVAGINHLYDDIKIYRDIIYFENNGFIIVDRCYSGNAKFMGQNFNLAPGITANKKEKNQYELITPEKKVLHLKEHTERTLNKYFSHENETRGFYSENFNELKETHQIEYRKNSMESFFITTLFEEGVDINHISKDNGSIKFLLSDTKYKIYLQKL